MSRNDLPNPGASNFGQRLREAVMTYLGRQGDPLDRGITLRDLIDGGVVRLRAGYTPGQAVAGGGSLPLVPEIQDEEPDLTPPPTPTGFAVSAAISHVFIEHDAPTYTQGHGHLRTRVYGKTVATGDPLPVFADAAEITQFTGRIHAHPSNPATTWRLWIKWESVDGVLSVSPAGGTNGLAATTGQDVAKLLEALTGQIRDTQLYQDLGARINLIDAADTVIGSVNARIKTVNTEVSTLSGNINTRVDELITAPTYSNTRTYAANELVVYNGELYRAKQTTTGNLPTNTTYWQKVGSYASSSQAVAAHASEITSLATNLSAEVSARTTLGAQVNDPTTGLPATRSSLINDYYTKASTDSAISVATTGLVSQTSLNTTLGSYATTATLTSNYYTKTATDSAISAATTNLVSATSLSTTLANYVTGATLSANYYTQTQTDSAISAATLNLVSQTALTTALNSYVTTATLTSNYYTSTNTDSAIASAGLTLASTYADFDSHVAWNFDANADGFAAAGASLTWQDLYVRVASTSNDPILISPSVSVPGAKFSVVRARVRRVAGTGWQGQLYYTTAGHGDSESYTKIIPNITVSDQWRVLEWDMAALSAGGGDWLNSTITRLRFDLGTTSADVFDIDWITVGRISPMAYTAAIQTLATTTAGPNGTTAQYTVKIDNNGYVTGYGLSSTANDSTPTSYFGVRADAFYIASPSGPGVAPAMPFIVRTTPTTINGVSVPVGVYLTDAFIQNGTITTAKIGDAAIDRAKIADGEITTAKIGDAQITTAKIGDGEITNAKIGSFIQSTNYAAGSAGWRIAKDGSAEFEAAAIRGQLTAAQIDSRGLTIRDANNNIVLSSGTVVGGGNLCRNGDFLLLDGPNPWPAHFAQYNNSAVASTQSVSAGGPIQNANYWRMTVNQAGSSTFGFYFNSASSAFGGWKANTNYVVSFYARSNVNFGVGFRDAWNAGPAYSNALQNPTLGTAWKRYVWVINFQNNTIDPNGFWTIDQSGLSVGTYIDFACVQVEQGDFPSGWAPAALSSLNKVTDTNVSTYIEAAAIGSLDISTTGKVKSGKTAYGSGTGWLLEYNGGTPRFDIGTSDQYMRWDGSKLEIKAKAENVVRTGVVDGASFSEGAYQMSTTATASVQFRSNGTVYTKQNNNAYGLQGNWYDPTTTSIGNSYWIKFAKVAGDTPSGALGSWLQLNTDHTLSISKAPTGAVSSTVQYQISTSSSGTPVVATGYVFIDAEAGT